MGILRNSADVAARMQLILTSGSLVTRKSMGDAASPTARRQRCPPGRRRGRTVLLLLQPVRTQLSEERCQEPGPAFYVNASTGRNYTRLFLSRSSFDRPEAIAFVAPTVQRT